MGHFLYDKINYRCDSATSSIYLIPNEPTVGQFFVAHFTTEAVWMPISCHRFDHPADDEFTAFVAARCKQYMEVTFAVFASLEFVENAILEDSETLGTPTTEQMPSTKHIEYISTQNTTTIIIIAIITKYTYTKHCVCHNSPLELTIFSCGSNPSSHREQNIFTRDMLAAVTLQFIQTKIGICLRNSFHSFGLIL